MTTSVTLALTLGDVDSLQAAYVDLFERGGLFVATQTFYPLGQAVSLSLRLPGDASPSVVATRVAWVTPPAPLEGAVPGVGLHFDATATGVRDRIERLLAGRLAAEGRAP
ncbi:PilZ domain-containing protein [Halomonas dongshanensis]|uniref:PilZ domain-containing protein n=1 Tax=Halomonas dongshanensis TaxID=2890835 RepID=A0ABT2EER7_9GAMM|nr:PilZ domain-containing protein [Halomonas dongshanensis]MCS2610076.1 PilZ domain-containing protein [Halomonas dongshanensis]